LKNIPLYKSELRMGRRQYEWRVWCGTKFTSINMFRTVPSWTGPFGTCSFMWIWLRTLHWCCNLNDSWLESCGSTFFRPRKDLDPSFFSLIFGRFSVHDQIKDQDLRYLLVCSQKQKSIWSYFFCCVPSHSSKLDTNRVWR
jgi:hypothetical protein